MQVKEKREENRRLTPFPLHHISMMLELITTLDHYCSHLIWA